MMNQLEVNRLAHESRHRTTTRQRRGTVGRALDPQFPIDEEINSTTLRIAECQYQPHVWVVPFTASATMPPASSNPEYRQVEVCRKYNPIQAYQIIDGVRSQKIDHGTNAPWGYLYVGRILPIIGRSEEGVPLVGEPSPNQTRKVMIKKLFKSVVDDQLLQGTKENPYKEILRMKQLAGRGRVTANDLKTFGEDDGFVEDAYANDHVLGCIDAMVDDNYLYIITPYCKHENLYQHLPLKPSENDPVESKARRFYHQMLENIQYLHRHGICHRDVDPSNFLVRDDGRILLMDLAMSFLIPKSGLVRHMGCYGKPSYCPPETLQKGLPFWAKQCDLWACTITLWNLVTGKRLYRYPGYDRALDPHHMDIIFKYAIMAGGFYPKDTNPYVLDEATLEETLLFTQISLEILKLSPEMLELFHGVLNLNPNLRWSIDDVMQCDWMRMPK